MTFDLRRVVVASENPGKAAEIARIFAGFFPGIVVLRPSDLDITVDYPPEGDSYHLNASAKALAAARQVVLPAVADDSGIEVDALGGRPGVRSARYAPTDAERVTRLLDELAGVPEPERRGARFRAVAVLAFPDRRTLVAEATWEGLIAAAPSGRGGFGYDPVFWDAALRKTAAEMAPDEKAARSHRGQALRRLAAQLRSAGTPPTP